MWKDLMRRALLAIRRWRLRRDTLRQLEALDDRMLRDIGLHRSELTSVVEECLPGPMVPYGIRRRSFIGRTVPAGGGAPGRGQDNDRSGLQPAA